MVCAVAISATVFAQGPASPPARDARTDRSPATGALAGRIVAADTEQPIRWASVGLISPERAFHATTNTDADGRYAFRDLPAGDYMLRASKGGFVSTSFGASKLLETPARIVVSPGRTSSGDLALERGGAIEGRILNEAGDPVQDLPVQAFYVAYDAGGRRRIAAETVARTDDQGYFRMHSMAPGRYFIQTSIPGVVSASAGGTRADDQANVRVYATPTGRFLIRASGPGTEPPIDLREAAQTLPLFPATFHPGTTRLSEASSIAVEAGRTASVSFSISTLSIASWSGSVEDSRGRVPENISAMLRSHGGALHGSMANSGTSNQFGFTPLPPDDYVLGVIVRGKGMEPEFAVRNFRISGQNVSEPTFRTAPGVTLSGAIETVAASSPLPPSGISIVALAALFPGLAGDPHGKEHPLRVAADGTFTFRNLFGPRLFRIEAGPAWAIKAIYLGDEEITDRGVDFTARTAAPRVRVLVTNRTGAVIGSVAADRGTASGQVLAFPESEELWGFDSRFTKITDVVPGGRFDIKGLLPGRYYVAHVLDLPPGAWADPDLLRTLKASATPAEVADGAETPILLKDARNK
jgi:Carboxypeptidase regulatory-like domain